MKKQIAEYERKSIQELEGDATSIREAIARLRLEVIVNRPKDSNILMKKSKQLARILTIITMKKVK
ncbi:hypothetical protein HY358_01385 [Candidatus Roizmanbacteria bacterium]|nr:hypothetical protein [Candidatus Roizmanbacteria bacterium]